MEKVIEKDRNVRNREIIFANNFQLLLSEQ